MLCVMLRPANADIPIEIAQITRKQMVESVERMN